MKSKKMQKIRRRILISVILSTILIIASCSKEIDTTAAIENLELTINNYQLNASGQTLLYNCSGEEVSGLVSGDDLYGQDGNYVSGEELEFHDNGDGTVTDLNTGLVWQKTPSATSFSWQEAVDYCEDLELANCDDWRIPSTKELFGIGDFSSGWPYINTEFFDLAVNVSKDEQFWTSNFYLAGTTHNGAPSAFGVNHVTGHIKAYPSEASGPMGNFVRAVRGGDYGINEYSDNLNGTISDNSTGLMWMQDDSGEAMDWEEALSYAENSQFANYSDWRLPNVKELQSIVDYSQTSFPAIDPFFYCTNITNEAGNDDYAYYWTSTSARFTSGEPYYYAWYVAFGRAVDGQGEDTHGAGAVRFDTKIEGGPLGEGGERYYNYVRLVRNIQNK